jgi:hypothetical protein
VAYLRAQPALEPTTPPRQISVVGAILLALLSSDFFNAQPAGVWPRTSPGAAGSGCRPRPSTGTAGGT